MVQAHCVAGGQRIEHGGVLTKRGHPDANVLLVQTRLGKRDAQTAPRAKAKNRSDITIGPSKLAA